MITFASHALSGLVIFDSHQHAGGRDASIPPARYFESKYAPLTHDRTR
jgi:hypothetical protein